MGKTVDFEKVRRRRQRVQTLKRLLLLAFVMILVGAMIFLNNYFVEEGLSVRVNDLVETFGGSGFPVQLPGGVIKDVKNVGNNLTVLNDTNLYIYNPKGKRVTNIQKMTDNTVVLTSKDRALTYDVGSRRYAVYSVSKQLLSRETEFAILCAAMGQGGEVAIVTNSRQYVADVVVYNRQFEDQIFRWASSENVVSGVSISPKGDMIAVSCVNAERGLLKSMVRLFRFSTGAEVQLDLPGELILQIEYYGEDAIGVLTDQQYLVMGADGRKKAARDLDGATVSGVKRLDDKVLLLLDHKETRTQDLLLLDGECKDLGLETMTGRIRDMALGNRHVYLLTDRGIEMYSHSLELEEEYPLANVSRIHLVGDKLYYFTNEEIRVLGEG